MMGPTERRGPRRENWETIMPNDVKTILSLVVMLAAFVLAYWSGSPIRPDFTYAVIGTAIFMVIAMWMFPEAGVKKGDIKRQ